MKIVKKSQNKAQKGSLVGPVPYLNSREFQKISIFFLVGDGLVALAATCKPMATEQLAIDASLEAHGSNSYYYWHQRGAKDGPAKPLEPISSKVVEPTKALKPILAYAWLDESGHIK